MLVSLNWIKQLTEVKVSNKELLKKIASQLAEIESVTDLGEKYKGVLVAEVVETGDHPDADKLGVYKLSIGRVKVQVVAKDKDLNIGDKVAYIAPGVIVPETADTPEPFMIKRMKLRGVDSNGMLPTGRELGFNNDHSCVLKLDKNLRAGTQIAKAYELDDLIIEVENKALTHRPDCFGLMGFAREIAGIQGVQFKTPKWFTDNKHLAAADQLKVSFKNEIPKVCKRATAVAMSSIGIQDSPLLMQTYLSRIGIKPISNVVDASNYIMVLTGQPTHAFDYDKIVYRDRKNKYAALSVRFPKKGEKLRLLDGRTIEPHSEAAVIASGSEVLDLAGMMGGKDTEVDQNTQKIVLVSCVFDLYSIRATSMKHGVFTEAVTRNARGQDTELAIPAAKKVVSMISENAGGMVASKTVDVYPVKPKARTIEAHTDKVNSLLGADFTTKQMASTLKHVEVKTTTSGKKLKITPPTWRPDLWIEEDVVEEVGRLNGYELIKASLPERSIGPVELSKEESVAQAIRASLSGAGANEVLTYNFVSEELFEKTDQDTSLAYKIRNSLSPELRYMRTSLLPSLLDKVNQNVRAGYAEFALFEVNKSHAKNDIGAQKLPNERHSVAFTFAADKKAAKKLKGAAFYQAKYFLDHAAKTLGIEFSYKTPNNSTAWVNNIKHLMHPERTALVYIGKELVGVVGEYKAEIVHKFKLPEHSAGFEIDLMSLAANISDDSKYAKLSQYPSIEQDVTFKTPNNVSYGDLFAAVSKFVSGKGLKTEVTPLSVYKKDHENRSRSISFRVKLQHMDKTLDSKQANRLMSSMISAVSKKTGASQVK